MCYVTVVASSTGDKLCHQLFIDAGYQLGKHVMALIPQVDPVSSIIIHVDKKFYDWKIESVNKQYYNELVANFTIL